MTSSIDKLTSAFDESLISLIGRRVREEREAIGLTQKDLAEQAGITRVTVSEIENGHREQIKLTVLEDMARVLGQSVRSFFTDALVATTIADILQQHNLTPRLGDVLLKLVRLPLVDQERVCRLLEQVVVWYETDCGER